MSIAVAHGYSMMYTSQRQEKDEPAGPLSDVVTPLPFQPALFGKGGVAPSSKRELNDRYNAEDDFDTVAVGDTPWDDAWFPVCWANVGSKSYAWDGEGWNLVPLTEGDLLTNVGAGIDSPADELLFVGVYPKTDKELNSVGTPTPSTAFAEDKYVCLTGQGIGAQYHWDGDAWLAGPAPA